jgi:hypothetical protein
MKREFIDLTATKHGHFDVLTKGGKRESKGGHLRQLWVCSCVCGVTFEEATGNIVTGRRKSCGCMRYKDRAYGVKPTHAPAQASETYLFSRTKSSAKTRGIRFDITLDDFCGFIYRDCGYCGSAPCQRYNGKIFHNGGRAAGGVTEVSRERWDKAWIVINGLDRIDSEGAYSVDNVVSCCKFCNIAKSTMTVVEFLAWAKRLVQHQKEIHEGQTNHARS